MAAKKMAAEKIAEAVAATKCQQQNGSSKMAPFLCRCHPVCIFYTFFK